MSGRLPLAGVRILAVEQFGAGPWATLQLADLGAEVIKIEDPQTGGDVGRYVPPYQDGEDSLFFETFNRGKRSVSLNLKDAADRAAFRRLVATADAVFANLRGDQPERLGLTYDALRDVNPRIVCCSLSGFGMTGPRAAQGAYDYVIQGMAGWMALTGEPGGPPTKSGLSLVDLTGGYAASIALLAGLWQARETGRGCDCDVSLFETALALLNYVGTWTASADYAPTKMPHSAHPSIVPFQVFPTRDGWISIACAKEKFFERLCDVIGREDLVRDARFATFAGRSENRESLLPELYAELGRWPTAELIDELTSVGVPCGPVNSVREALDDPQAVARGVVQTIEHPRLGQVTHIASPLRLSPGGTRPILPAPSRGADTTELVGEPVAAETSQPS